MVRYPDDWGNQYRKRQVSSRPFGASAPWPKGGKIAAMLRFQPFPLAPIAARLRPLGSAVRTFGRGLLDLALPPRCLYCDADFQPPGDIMICPQCVQLVAPELPTCCPWCGAILPDGIQPSQDCPACKDFRLKFDTVFPLGRYDGPLRDMVLRTKRISGEALSLAVGGLLAARLFDRIAAFGPQVVVPIPMHWRRQLWRGMNRLGFARGVPGPEAGHPGGTHAFAAALY